MSLLPRPAAFARRLIASVLTALACTAHAADVRSPALDPAFEAAVNAARRVTRAGPASVPLGPQGTLNLPAGFEFIPQPEAGALLRTRAHADPAGLIGLIQSRGHEAWLVTVRFDAVGHIPGDTDLQASDDELLARLRSHLALAPGFEITGWAQHPAYDPQTHRLVWAAQLRRTADGTSAPAVNYNAALLGREGVLGLHLMTGAASLASDKRQLHELLSAMDFVPGQRHADFDPARDRRSSLTPESLVAAETGPEEAQPVADTGLPAWVWAAWVGVLAAMALLLRRLLGRRPAPAPLTPAGTGPAGR